jgi:Bardet-Biedl syndrome 4 protein
LQVIDKVLEGPKTGHAYFAMFTKAMVLRQQGQIQGSLSALEEAIRLDPQNPRNLKEIARSLHLLGKHKVALDVYDEALKKNPHDWELYHDKGLCHVYLKNLAEYDIPTLG